MAKTQAKTHDTHTSLAGKRLPEHSTVERPQILGKIQKQFACYLDGS
jgi:hypothetical protein